MNTRTVYKESVFPADIDTVFGLLTNLKTLQYIAAPYASFTPESAGEPAVWTAGKVFSFKFRLLGFIPFGTHTIRVIRFSREGIYTNERNTHVPVWNHRIRLTENGNGTTRYSDEVEIGAGRKTFFIWCWANCFYRHRQRKWIKLLKMQEA